MFVKTILIKSFKGFETHSPIKFQIPNGYPGSGLNIFVGENNSGKSTLFEALEFVRNGTKKDLAIIKNKNLNQDSEVSLTFEGEITTVIDNFSQSNKAGTFKRYIFINDEVESLTISRNTAEVKQLMLWDAKSNQYINEAGIDAPIKKLFETNFVWADTNPSDETSFGATTICGSLLKEIASNFIVTDDYKSFINKFHEIFNSEDSGLKRELAKIEGRVQAIFNDLFSDARIRFQFDELKIDSFFKNTTIEVDDGINTSMQEKGNGMQRAVALALLQVYAEELRQNPNNAEIKKPLYLFLDEPEICLHPKGQEKLLTALLEISKTQQIFLTTHSPYFLATQYLKDIGLHVFTKNNNSINVEQASNNQLFPWSPTWGEINFKAYKLPTVELHNELYGRLQEQSECKQIQDFDKWLIKHGVQSSKIWIKQELGIEKSSSSVTLSTFIRNQIHHPENTLMNKAPYTKEELRQSTEEMINLLNKLSKPS